MSNTTYTYANPDTQRVVKNLVYPIAYGLLGWGGFVFATFGGLVFIFNRGPFVLSAAAVAVVVGAVVYACGFVALAVNRRHTRDDTLRSAERRVAELERKIVEMRHGIGS